MSLPPGFLEELRTRITLSSVVGRKVTWDRRKSNQAKGDWWAPCPFHQEKSASFHVDDRKGFYYCFGCHAKGNAVTFLRESENQSFMEAVESLAREAGMSMPARDPVAAQKADRRSQLAEVMEEAVKWYRLQLKTASAGPARDYLDRRGLGPAGQERFGIGWAPDNRQGIFQALTAKGIAPDLIVDAGLCARPEDGGAPYDRFRGRIIFPIRDGRGRAISLGGRSMDPEARAKYLNGPETELFDKGRNLYNQQAARNAVAKGAPLIVTEGYMDVIALSEAGFGGAVAPLGTAITEEQLRLLWRISPEPVVALDGDKAGIRAAERLIDLALPLLEAGNALRFAVMPAGEDPDDLIRARGAQAMAQVIEGAQPMVELLWRRETAERVFDSPERRAALDLRLRELIRQIRDPSLRGHYASGIARMRAELFGLRAEIEAPARASRGGYEAGYPGGFDGGGPQGGFGGGTYGGTYGGNYGGAGPGGGRRRPWRPGGRAPIEIQPLAGTRASMLAAAAGDEEGLVEDRLREAIILAICAAHPVCITAFESDLERMDLIGEGHDALRGALLRGARDPGEGFRDRLDAVARGILETIERLPHVAIAPPARPDADPALARMCLAEELAKLAARRGIREEIADAVADLAGFADEGVTWRLGKAAEARQRAERSRLNDSSDLGEDRDALTRQLQDMIDREVWRKQRR